MLMSTICPNTKTRRDKQNHHFPTKKDNRRYVYKKIGNDSADYSCLWQNNNIQKNMFELWRTKTSNKIIQTGSQSYKINILLKTKLVLNSLKSLTVH